MKPLRGISRREALKLGLGTVAGAVAGLLHARPVGVTPSQVKGPFYPNTDQPDEDLDLTRIEGREGRARGRVIIVEGRVLDEQGEPVEDALVEIWQANAHGRYHHERDNNRAPLDPGFQGWGHVVTGAEGRYLFRTIKPGAYPATDDWSRPPHIHFKVARRGYHELITQMYFSGEPLNDVDRLLQALAPAEQARLVVSFENGGDQGEPRGRFDIVLRAVA